MKKHSLFKMIAILVAVVIFKILILKRASDGVILVN